MERRTTQSNKIFNITKINKSPIERLASNPPKLQSNQSFCLNNQFKIDIDYNVIDSTHSTEDNKSHHSGEDKLVNPLAQNALVIPSFFQDKEISKSTICKRIIPKVKNYLDFENKEFYVVDPSMAMSSYKIIDFDEDKFFSF